jgi:hypothetical protein
MGTVFAYIRVTYGEAEDADTIASQKTEAEAYFHQSLESQGLVWGGHFVDAAETRTRQLSERPEGRKLSRRLARGNHVIIVQFACGFRDTMDFLACCRRWAAQDISWSALDLKLLDMGPRSVGAFEIFGRMSAADSARHAERLRQAHVTRKGTGRAPNQHAGFGFRLVGPRGRKRRVVDEVERRTMGRIVELRDSGCSWSQAAVRLMHDGVTRNGREWSPSTVRRAHKAELALRQAETETPRKTCRRCGQRMPLDVTHFHRNSSELDGYHRACKGCRSAERRELREKKRTKRRAAAINKFQKAATKRSQPTGECGTIAEQMGGADQFAEEFMAEYHDSQPGSRKRVGLLIAAMKIAIRAGVERADEIDLPDDGT